MKHEDNCRPENCLVSYKGYLFSDPTDFLVLILLLFEKCIARDDDFMVLCT